MGSALKWFENEHGVSGREVGSNPTYIAAAHLNFETVEDFKASYGPHADKIQSDNPNCTDFHPIMQVNEVRETAMPHKR